MNKCRCRCTWVNLNNKLYIDYHDKYWGRPSYDDDYLFEMLMLESFQAGLSFECILNKRNNFKKAFDNFNYNKISKYDDKKINELMQNKGIIRNKLKIKAIINNAKIFIKIREEYKIFSNYIWHFTNNKIVKNETDKIPTHNDLSDKISKDLKSRGMSFVGTVIIYSDLQSIGIINDHEKKCYLYERDNNYE